MGLCACCVSPAGAGVLQTDLQAVVDAGYEPVDADERGIWQSLERIEEYIRTSPQRMNSPDLDAYTRRVVERLVGRSAPDVRIYVMRDASFNASMAPSGFMIVHTGLLARMRNEAQYAAVLGHEAGHYFRRHSLEGYRNLRRKAAVGAFISAAAGIAAGASAGSGYGAQSWIDSANAINAALTMSIFQFSRGQESEADAYGIMLLARAGYSPFAAADVWNQLIDERKASAAQRAKKYKDAAASMLSTHPPSEERMMDLADTAEYLAGKLQEVGIDGREAWLAATRPYQAQLVAEQVSLNDPGASLYLLDSLSRDGWTAVLRYNEGEVYRLRAEAGDDQRAIEAYAAALALPDAPPEAWRAKGYALLKTGHKDEAHAALNRYLELMPGAKDAGMVRFTLDQ
jgi:predicted Zn-dependent protease